MCCLPTTVGDSPTTIGCSPTAVRWPSTAELGVMDGRSFSFFFFGVKDWPAWTWGGAPSSHMGSGNKTSGQVANVFLCVHNMVRLHHNCKSRPSICDCTNVLVDETQVLHNYYRPNIVLARNGDSKGHQQARKVDKSKEIAKKWRKIALNCENCRPQYPRPEWGKPAAVLGDRPAPCAEAFCSAAHRSALS